jgi:hypothetical protein
MDNTQEKIAPVKPKRQMPPSQQIRDYLPKSHINRQIAKSQKAIMEVILAARKIRLQQELQARKDAILANF